MAKHLTLEERDRIAHLKSRGFTQAAIAKALGRSPSVISREVRRNGTEDGMYYGGVAHPRLEGKAARPQTILALDHQSLCTCQSSHHCLRHPLRVERSTRRSGSDDVRQFH